METPFGFQVFVCVCVCVCVCACERDKCRVGLLSLVP